MRFLVDVQLPRRAATWLINAGYDAVHTLDLPDGNRTTDQPVIDLADREGRAVVTKDADFVDSHLLRSRPEKLFLISIGNISNLGLEALVVPLISDIIREFQTHAFLELGPSGLVVRGYSSSRYHRQGRVQETVLDLRPHFLRPKVRVSGLPPQDIRVPEPYSRRLVAQFAAGCE